MNRLVCILMAIVLLQSCSPKEEYGIFFDDVLNLEQLNSAADDYNSAPTIFVDKRGQFDLVFSSTRINGKTFNLVNKSLFLDYNEKSRKLFVTDPGKTRNNYGYLERFVSKVNGSRNVLGPNIISYEEDFKPSCCYSKHSNEYALFYADDESGNLDIKMVDSYGNKSVVSNSISLDVLNSPQDDAYPSFRNDHREVYFCSNRGGTFDIYRAKLPADSLLARRFSNSELVKVEKVPELASAGNDKCPYVFGNLMVFVSDRPGGLGGFDIYYSIFNGSTWGTPINAGVRINTKNDEYRPIFLNNIREMFRYPLMVFSSNRPGGKGGFDLYLTGLLNDSDVLWKRTKE